MHTFFQLQCLESHCPVRVSHVHSCALQGGDGQMCRMLRQEPARVCVCEHMQCTMVFIANILRNCCVCAGMHNGNALIRRRFGLTYIHVAGVIVG